MFQCSWEIVYGVRFLCSVVTAPRAMVDTELFWSIFSRAEGRDAERNQEIKTEAPELPAVCHFKMTDFKVKDGSDHCLHLKLTWSLTPKPIAFTHLPLITLAVVFQDKAGSHRTIKRKLNTSIICYYMANLPLEHITHFSFAKINRFILVSARVWSSCTERIKVMLLHGLYRRSLGEEEVIHMLKVKANGELWSKQMESFGTGRISSSAFLPGPVWKCFVWLFAFHLLMCGPFSTATWEIYLTNSSCQESVVQNKKLVAYLMIPAPFLWQIMVAAFVFCDRSTLCY